MEELVESIQENVAGLYFRSVLLGLGVRIPQHKHPYDHATLVASGAVILYVDGVESGDYCAGEAVEIKANKLHEFESLMPNTRLVCIHHTASAEAAMLVPTGGAECLGE
jgi:quercetin dioxygenase-like cupin family protein